MRLLNCLALLPRPPPACPTRRQRLEYLKKRRRNWEMVYARVTRADALCTLSAIEEANARVEELLSEESRERHSVSGGWVLGSGCAGHGGEAVGTGAVLWRCGVGGPDGWEHRGVWRLAEPAGTAWHVQRRSL
jgi:hypothetical protein